MKESMFAEPEETKPKKAPRSPRRAHRKAKMTSAKATSLRPPGKKVRIMAVQKKKDASVFKHSGGKYNSVAAMQKAGGVDPLTGRKKADEKRDS